MKQGLLMSFVIVLLGVGSLLGSACSNGVVSAAAVAGNAAAGESKFVATCSVCHGQEAQGLTGMGKDLTTSAFAKSKTDAELVTFLTKGRAANEPLNTTGVIMPPRGGNPAISDGDLYDIVAYLRTLEK